MIAEAAHVLRCAIHFAMEVLRAGRTLEQNGNPAAQFRLDPAGVDVLLFLAD